MSAAPKLARVRNPLELLLADLRNLRTSLVCVEPMTNEKLHEYISDTEHFIRVLTNVLDGRTTEKEKQ